MASTPSGASNVFGQLQENSRPGYRKPMFSWDTLFTALKQYIHSLNEKPGMDVDTGRCTSTAVIVGLSERPTAGSRSQLPFAPLTFRFPHPSFPNPLTLRRLGHRGGAGRLPLQVFGAVADSGHESHGSLPGLL